jgi:hypothetical protein
MYLAHHHDNSWAQVTDTDAETHVEHGGPQDLWMLVERAHARWLHHGQPPPSQFSLVVGAVGTYTVRLGATTWTSFTPKITVEP